MSSKEIAEVSPVDSWNATQFDWLVKSLSDLTPTKAAAKFHEACNALAQNLTETLAAYFFLSSELSLIYDRQAPLYPSWKF